LSRSADLERGRESFDRQSWADAHAQLSAADRGSPLAAEDLQMLATAAFLTGKEDESLDAWQRAHLAFLGLGDTERAVRCAMQLAIGLINRGEFARAGGWLARAGRLLEDGQHDCVEVGYLLIPAALQSLMAGEAAIASGAFQQAIELAERFGDADLLAMGRLGLGQSLITLGQTARGVALLDEIMVAVTAGEVSPIIAGTAYCAVIDICHAIFDLRRAQQWTAALNHWCESQPGLVAYRGPCLVFRAQIMQLHGAWGDAMSEALKAREWLSGPPPQQGAGNAFYQLAELHRLRGELAKAEEGYRQASEAGRSPQPGLALLRLVQGKVDAAAAAVRRERDETRDRAARCRLLPAYVEVMIADRDHEAARAGAEELSDLAESLDAPVLRAAAAQAQGAVLLAEGDDRGALESLRRAWTTWRELDAPYDAARVRVLIGLACRRIGDGDAAEMELNAARHVFLQIGAATDLAGLERLSERAPKVPGGLSAREVQVLRLVAAGRTNRAIAAELVISEKTVARHVSNIFTKLGLSNRSAAAAYAHEHGLK
jgi:DNA-binding CsgD family transcriptional regulator